MVYSSKYEIEKRSGKLLRGKLEPKRQKLEESPQVPLLTTQQLAAIKGPAGTNFTQMMAQAKLDITLEMACFCLFLSFVSFAITT